MNRREMLLTSGGFMAAAGVADAANSAEDRIVESAKAMIRNHESKAERGDIDEVVTNISREIVLFAPGARLVQGIDSFRDFYQSILDMGMWSFRHDYSGHDVEGEAVILYGVARGTLKAADQDPEPFANNFLIVARPEDGRFKIWRAAFAPNDQFPE